MVTMLDSRTFYEMHARKEASQCRSITTQFAMNADSISLRRRDIVAEEEKEKRMMHELKKSYCSLKNDKHSAHDEVDCRDRVVAGWR